MADTNIRITNVKATIAALDTFAPEVKKAMNKTIRQALDVVRTGAEQRYPKGAWSININQKKILGAISARGGGERAARWGDSAPGIRAAIFEFAGSTQPGKTPQARAMIESLNRRYGAPGRFLWDAWDSQGQNALDQIQDAVYGAERELQAKLDGMGESY